MLEIERGRHVKPQKIPLEQRTRKRCTSKSVDDEIPFLITCSYFATQITSFIAENKLHNIAFDSLSNNDKFIYIMSCLAKYTYTCFQIWALNKRFLLRYIVIWNNYKSPVSISSIFHDLT